MCMRAHTQKKSEDLLLWRLICLPCRTQEPKDTDAFGYNSHSSVLVSLSVAAVKFQGGKGLFALQHPVQESQGRSLRQEAGGKN